ncbi:MAG: RluA family pseudouridine synthase [Clostridiaceae bacterium]|nr:RluA family pseudouridine synthase [Clostridiaceae bacterium]
MIEKIYFMDNSKTRLDKWLSQRMPKLSRSQIVKLIDAKQVIIDDQFYPQGKDVLAENSKITVRYEHNSENKVPQAQKIELDIIFEDDDFIVINKPINLVVHPGAGNEQNTLVNGLLHYTKELSTINSKERPGIVHRLDKDTSGLILICKHNTIHREMAQLFKTHQVKRIYHALVWGLPDTEKGKINAPIDRHPTKRTMMSVEPQGKEALTFFQLLNKFTNTNNQPIASELKIKLHTGRTHQIRVHLAHINLPIIGDPLYHKGRDNLDIPAQALYSSELSFHHPINGVKMHFQVDAPDFYQELKERLDKHLV